MHHPKQLFLNKRVCRCCWVATKAISVTRWLDYKFKQYLVCYNSKHLPKSINNLPREVENVAKYYLSPQ